MNRKRLPRETSKEQTKQRLLDAAQTLVATHGFEATSVEAIAAAAGYTRGAFYSNFQSKHDIFIEALRREHKAVTAQLRALMSDDVPIEEIKANTRDLYSTYCGIDGNFLSWTNARMLATRDPKFRGKLNVLLAEKRDQLAQFVIYFYQRADRTLPLPAPYMAMGFMSVIEGVKLFELSSPTEMTAQSAQRILTLFMDSVIDAKQP